jgi:hypothetical protein
MFAIHVLFINNSDANTLPVQSFFFNKSCHITQIKESDNWLLICSCSSPGNISIIRDIVLAAQDV